MNLDFIVPKWGKLSADQILSNLHVPDDDEVARIDLTETTWSEPAGLVAVAALAEAQRSEGRSVEVLAPQNPNVARFLARMHLGQVLDELGCDHNLPAVRESQGLELLEAQQFEGEEGAAGLAALVYEKTAMNAQVAAALYCSIVEIGSNVSQHSGRPHGYVAAVSTYGGKIIEFAVADAGRGLTRNLKSIGSMSDQESLAMVLDRGVTSTGEPGRGRGIRETRRLVNDLSGRVEMITGRAGREAHKSASFQRAGLLPFPGTVLQGSLRCP